MSLATIRKIIDLVLNSVEKSLAFRYAFYFYNSVVLIGALYGITKGFQHWINWRRTRKPIKIINKTLEPIVNNSVDAGQLGFQLLMTGLISAFVVGTAPISVPLIILTMR